jgi:uncharacterized protein (DUF302 family)
MRPFLLLLALLALPAHAADWMVRKQVHADFDEVRDSVVMAIENRGLVVNYVSHIGDMLERTGNDIGAKRKIFSKAETIEFCSAALSRKMMEADPHNIVLCPFAISIYTVPGETGTWVAYRRPQGSAAKQVEPLLAEIASEAGK